MTAAIPIVMTLAATSGPIDEYANPEISQTNNNAPKASTRRKKEKKDMVFGRYIKYDCIFVFFGYHKPHRCFH